MQIVTLIPTYSTFGHQFYLEDGHEKQCTVEQIGSVKHQCIISQIGRFIHTMSIESPFLSVILFYANLLFIAFYFLFLGTGFFMKSQPDDQYTGLNGEEDPFDSD
jgi:hypothetical protein